MSETPPEDWRDSDTVSTQPGKCNDGRDHAWQPVSFRFETQVLDEYGRVNIRQPDLEKGHVYCVCLGCNCWTYVETKWVGYYLGGPADGLAGPTPHRGLVNARKEQP